MLKADGGRKQQGITLWALEHRDLEAEPSQIHLMACRKDKYSLKTCWNWSLPAWSVCLVVFKVISVQGWDGMGRAAGAEVSEQCYSPVLCSECGFSCTGWTIVTCRNKLVPVGIWGFNASSRPQLCNCSSKCCFSQCIGWEAHPEVTEQQEEQMTPEEQPLLFQVMPLRCS